MASWKRFIFLRSCYYQFVYNIFNTELARDEPERNGNSQPELFEPPKLLTEVKIYK